MKSFLTIQFALVYKNVTLIIKNILDYLSFHQEIYLQIYYHKIKWIHHQQIHKLNVT